MFVSLSALVPNPVEWLSKTPPGNCPHFDLSDPEKVRAVLMDLYNKGVSHHQHGALLKQDVCVAKVSSWVVADSMKGAPGIFEDNDPELVKKLKETLQQSDAQLKLGIGGGVHRGGSGEGGGGRGHGARKGPGKGRGGNQGGEDSSHLRCFHCRQNVFSFFRCLLLLQPFLFSGTSEDTVPKVARERERQREEGCSSRGCGSRQG